jgi:uncharacterized membrane protein YvlD (DUF360 family)
MSDELPEFHIVVRRPSQKGPLAPYKFAISVVVAFAIAFSDIRLALASGVVDDAVLLRAVGAALFTWVVLTVLNRILKHAETR